MRSDIRKIINDGVLAPSGENCQPWKFILKGELLSIFNVPEADTSLYNLDQKGSYIAHGALLENISLSASERGYKADITKFPSDDNENHVANITFSKTEPEPNPLYRAIGKRCTNRKEYSGEKLSTEEKTKLTLAVEQSGSNTLLLVDGDEERMRVIGRSLAAHEKVLFEHKKMHDFFYDHILWDEKDERKAGGFYIKTLEFLPHQLGAVKLFKNWTLLKLFNRFFKVSTMISEDNGKKYARSGTFGAITLSDESNSGYLELGMSLQRVWLAATNLGLAFHPCNGTLYLMKYLHSSGQEEFSLEHKKLIETSYRDIVSSFSTGKEIAFIFRVGKADASTSTAKRLEAEVVEMAS